LLAEGRASQHLIATCGPRCGDQVGGHMRDKAHEQKRASWCFALEPSDQFDRPSAIQVNDDGFSSACGSVCLNSILPFRCAHDFNSDTGLARGLPNLHRKEEIIHNSNYSHAFPPSRCPAFIPKLKDSEFPAMPSKFRYEFYPTLPYLQ
jgi:hypothetical protein